MLNKCQDMGIGKVLALDVELFQIAKLTQGSHAFYREKTVLISIEVVGFVRTRDILRIHRR